MQYHRPAALDASTHQAPRMAQPSGNGVHALGPYLLHAGRSGTLKSVHQFVFETHAPLATRFHTDLLGLQTVDIEVRRSHGAEQRVRYRKLSCCSTSLNGCPASWTDCTPWYDCCRTGPRPEHPAHDKGRPSAPRSRESITQPCYSIHNAAGGRLTGTVAPSATSSASLGLDSTSMISPPTSSRSRVCVPR